MLVNEPDSMVDPVTVKEPAFVWGPITDTEPDSVVEPVTIKELVPKVPTWVLSTKTPKEPLATLFTSVGFSPVYFILY